MDPAQKRNLNAHAEAHIARVMWGREYAYKQRGGVMDFWEKYLNEDQRRRVRMALDEAGGRPREKDWQDPAPPHSEKD